MRPLREWGMRARITGLLGAAFTLVTAGIVADWWWLVGIGAWVLIAAGLLEMVYRP